jgi:hypothetical protein
MWLYHSRPTRMAFHDLTTRLKPPKNLRSLLGLNLKFVPNPGRNASWASIEKDILPRFDRDLRVKVFMAGAEAEETYNPKMYAASEWNPPNLFTPPELRARLAAFKAALKGLYKKRRCPSNLLKHQRRALDALRNQDTFLIVQCDKNLGPAVIEKTEYIRMALAHLTDTSTYRRLSPLEARMYSGQFRQTILQWIKTHTAAVSKNETKYLRRSLSQCSNPFGAFYLMMKVHKETLSSRAIMSASGSLLYLSESGSTANSNRSPVDNKPISKIAKH